MKYALLLLLAASANAQTTYYVPVQCGPGGCPGGACRPQYYYQQPQQYYQPQQQRPSPDGIQTPQVGSPNTPQFQPLPPPPPVTTPAIPAKPAAPIAGPAGPVGPPGPAGKDGSDATCGCGPKWAALDIRLGVIENSLAEIKDKKPPEAPSAPAAEQHIVILADHNADYWQKLAEEMQKTAKTYKGVRESPLPDFPIGIHPQLVVYQGGVPIRIVKGLYEVENVLARLSRGDPI